MPPTSSKVFDEIAVALEHYIPDDGRLGHPPRFRMLEKVFLYGELTRKEERLLADVRINGT